MPQCRNFGVSWSDFKLSQGPSLLLLPREGEDRSDPEFLLLPIFIPLLVLLQVELVKLY